MELSESAALAENESPFTYSVHVHDPAWLQGRHKIESFSSARLTATRSSSPEARLKEPYCKIVKLSDLGAERAPAGSLAVMTSV